MSTVDRLTIHLNETDLFQIMRASAILFMGDFKQPFLSAVWRTNLNEHLALSEILKDFLWKREPSKIQYNIGKEGVEAAETYLILSLKKYILNHKPEHIECVV